MLSKVCGMSFKLFHFFSQNIHQGYPTGTLVRFLKARERNVPKAHKMVRSSSFARTVLQNFLLFFEKKNGIDK